MPRSVHACVALALTTITAHAQITVTNSVFPVIGDTLHYAYGNQPNAINAVYTPPGGPQNWDLSGLQADSTWDAIYRDPTTGVGSADFPGAALMVVPAGALPGQEDYLSVSGTAVSYMGSRGVDPLHLGSSWTVHRYPSLPTDWAPVNFFDIRQATTSSLTNFPPSEMPPGWSAQYPAIDSLRLRTAIQLLSVVDAWGTLTIPGGSYAVLRDKRTRYTTARLDAKLQGLGWLDVTDQAITQWGMDYTLLAVDTTSYFHFINDQTKETIALCTFDPALNVVTNVRYKVVPDISTAIDGATSSTSLRVYPNPATDRIGIQAPGLRSGAVDLVIMDAMGRTVMHSREAAHASGLALNINGLEAGLYVGSIVPDAGAPMTFRFVKR